MFSILHLSDLHRSPSEPVNNDSLIAALIADCDRYIAEVPAIPVPDAIVVSGDIVQGSRVGDADFRATVNEQYNVAFDFLTKLSQRFLGGDKSRLILIPGNHDVCWNTSLAAMTAVPRDQYPPNIRSELDTPESPYRWSWNELSLYKVTNQTLYASRLDAYWAFVERFYAGISLLLPVDRQRGFQLFELCNRKIIVAAFDSTAGNDCFCHAGSILQGSVARCDLALRDMARQYDLRIAVWHHSTQGPPVREDYMDVNQVHEMVGLGFQLGLHGHQHLAAASTHYIHLNQSQPMAVVSAGSLCAGLKELPRGTNRQYNVISIADDFRGAHVHVREMSDGGHFARKSNGAFIDGFAKLDWQLPRDLAGRPINAAKANARHCVLRAEHALRTGDPNAALVYLGTIDLPPGSYERRLAIEAAQLAQEWQKLVDAIGSAANSDEAVALAAALIQIGKLSEAQLALDQQPDIPVVVRNDMQDRIDVARMLGSQ